MNILIINYGTSNINSIYNSLKRIKKIKIFINNFSIKKYDKIIFPGQGHIKTCINFLSNIENLKYYINNTHILGICIGYHIFFSKSDENQKINCLKYFNEKISTISNKCCVNSFTPNINWCPVYINKYHKIFHKIPNKIYQYFMNSYSCLFNNQSYSFAISEFNNKKFNAIIIEENKFLFQFHPEKGGNIGSKILENFLKL